MKKLIQIIILITSFSSMKVSAQNYNWNKQFGGTNNADGRTILHGDNGHLITIGNFQGLVDFDPGIGTYNLTSKGSNDIYITKQDSSGNLIWAKSLEGTGNDWPNSVKLDESGNLFIVGTFQTTVDFDPGIGVNKIDALGDWAGFILKLDPNGNFVWVKKIGPKSRFSKTEITELTFDKNHDIIISGNIVGTTDFDPGASTYNLTSAGGWDGFVGKYDSSGKFIWAKRFGNNGEETAEDCTVDTNGNIYLTGVFMTTVDFDLGIGTYNLTSVGRKDIYILKLDESGKLQWANSIGGTNHDQSHSLVWDNSGYLGVCGFFQGSVDFDPGNGTKILTSAGGKDIYIMKLDKSGNFVWAKAIGSAGEDIGFSIGIDKSSAMYVCGSFTETIDFDPGVGSNVISSNGGLDIFLTRFTPQGEQDWTVTIGGGNNDYAKSLTIGYSDSVDIYSTGSFSASVDFNPGVGVQSYTSLGGTDIFVHKMSYLNANTVGINNIQSSFITLYPNPASKEIKVKIESNLLGSKFRIINVLGQEMKQGELNNITSSVDVSTLRTGHYVLRIEESNYSHKFLVQ